MSVTVCHCSYRVTVYILCVVISGDRYMLLIWRHNALYPPHLRVTRYMLLTWRDRAHDDHTQEGTNSDPRPNVYRLYFRRVCVLCVQRTAFSASRFCLLRTPFMFLSLLS
jgi:hypothetical protein